MIGEVTSVREERVEGDLPLFEVPGWREKHGVIAGITGRGDAAGSYDLGLWGGRPVGDVMRRWSALRRMEPGIHGVVLGHQVHGTDIGRRDRVEGWLLVDGVDGHVTDEPGIMLSVTVADCIPVYLLDPVTRAVGLLHSGWRGTAAGMLEAGVEALNTHYGSDPTNIVMHCGVGICDQCYEVGSEVMDALGLERVESGPWHADLRGVIARQAEALGVRTISTSQYCSAHDSWFHSHRASGGRDGRMVAYLSLKA